ncbi:hypothetical protein [Pseudomonas sp. R3-52-08]|uniref:hypothetical protein n=1 Tax=Pseudomonas sp. R3-52-08 TaxID=1173284 RepID=UPI000F579D6E|nr:hypothetical protein [Pseudomonas sp. R3-52-08]
MIDIGKLITDLGVEDQSGQRRRYGFRTKYVLLRLAKLCGQSLAHPNGNGSRAAPLTALSQ